MAEEIKVTTEKANPTSIHDLNPKMELLGTVSKTDLYGAFVDIGVGRDGLVHISRIRKGAINRVDEVLSVGEKVTVYIDRVDAKTGRISLTMLKPLEVTWRDLQKGQTYHGKVTRVEQYGIFVDIGAERPGLAHISELGDEISRHPNELYTVNQSIDVRVLDYDRKKRRIDLSLNQAETVEQTDEEEAVELPTAMEMAMRSAYANTDTDLPSPSQRKQGRRRAKRRQRQNDLLERTLRSRKS